MAELLGNTAIEAAAIEWVMKLERAAGRDPRDTRFAGAPADILSPPRVPDDLHTFQVLPRRWVVERTLAWITRCRRTVRDYERLPAHHETMVHWAMTITMTRRLAHRRPAFQPSAP
jgi:Transposase DDE domain